MKPAPFAYTAPGELGEVLGFLTRDGGDAKILAGGQSLLPMLNLRLARPQLLVDINRVAELSGIQRHGTELRIGATTRQREAERAVVAELPLLAAALRHVGHLATRARGTIGGSLAHADPAAEVPAVLLTLDGSIVAVSDHGERVIPAADFLVGTFATCLRDDELVREVRFPCRPHATYGFVEFARRHGDFALVGAAVELERGRNGVCERVAITVFGVSDVPLRMSAVERDLLSRDIADGTVAREVAAAVSAAVDPGTDIHATGAYRKRVAGVAVARALRLASGAEAVGR